MLMASRSVNSGGSIKARKGNGAERLIAYNLMQRGLTVTRLDDNTAGIDLKAEMENRTFYIEVKFHQKFSWNEIVKVFKKTGDATYKIGHPLLNMPLFVFKSNRQPWLVVSFIPFNGEIFVASYDQLFQPIVPIPKGYKVWKENKV